MCNKKCIFGNCPVQPESLSASMNYKSFLPSIIILSSLFSCGSVKQDDDITLRQTLDSMFQNTPDFSGVLLVAENGQPVYHKAFGYKTFEDKTPLDTTAIFELASVSKQFTAMIIMMLEEDGLLDYDDALEKHIPDLSYPGVTIRHLLHHTSGLPDYQAVMDQHWDKSKVAGNEDNIAYLIQHHPPRIFSPGEKYEYSNTGYMLLASIAEKVSGKDFITLCRQRIFLPLNMNSTDLRTKTEKVQLANMAWGHIWVPEKKAYIHADSFPAFNYSIWLGNRKGPGRISATATDLLKWDQALYETTLVKKETLARAFSPATLNDGSISPYGFGWSLDDHRHLGRKVFHTGDNPGYKTIIIRYIDSEKSLILLSNNQHEKFEELVRSLEEILD